MTLRGSNVAAISIGGNVLSQFIESDLTLVVEALLEASHGLGDSWEESAFTGVKKGGDVSITFRYSEAASEVNATLAGNEGTDLAVIATWASGKTSTFTAMLVSYQRTATRGAITKATAVLRPNGVVTEA